MYKCGYVGIIGRTNAGKSTLVNTLVGEKVAIVSPKKQTTRENISGILTSKKYQIIFVDTPGIHKTKNKLDKLMMNNVRNAIASVDLLLYILNGEKIPQNDEIENIIKLSTEIPTIIGISKQDIAKPEITAKIITILSKIKDLRAIIPFSSLNGENLDAILNEILKILPESKEKNFYFEEDLYTDKSIKFMSEEIIREQAFYYLFKNNFNSLKLLTAIPNKT